MGDEFQSEITVDSANDGALCGTLNFKAGASAEFHNGKDGQIDDAAGEDTLMHDIFPLSRLDLPACCDFAVPCNVQYWAAGVSPRCLADRIKVSVVTADRIKVSVVTSARE